MANAIVQINRRAKQMVAANKKLPWKDAIQKASAEYRRGKTSGVKKVSGAKKTGSVKSAAKKVTKAAKSVAKSVKSHYALHQQNKRARLKEKCKSIGAVKKDGLQLLNDKYGKLAVRRLGATRVRDIKSIGKDMRAVAGQIRKIKSL